MQHTLMLMALGAAISGFAFACADDGGNSQDTNTSNDGFTTAELAVMNNLSPLPPVAPDRTNAFADNPGAAALGQRLFFDKSFSGALVVGNDASNNGGLGAAGDTGAVACASCHSSKATDDDRTIPNNVSLGTDYGARNALSIVNSSFYKWSNWGGRFDSQWSLSLAVAENPAVMKSTRLQIAHMLFDKYRADYDSIFPALDPALASTAADAARFPMSGKPKASASDRDGAWEGMAPSDQEIVNRIFVNFGKAIAAYIRLNVSRNAPFDKYVAGDKTAIGADAKRGLKVFLGKGRCAECHFGPNFTDDKFHNLGLEQTGPHVPPTDTGRFGDIAQLVASPFNTDGSFSDDARTGKLSGLVAQEANRGQFRTKSLRGLSGSGPYMHAGQLASLEEVVSYYARGGATPPVNGGKKDPKISPLNLNATEASDLVAFLKTLDGDPVSAELLVNTSK